MKKLIVLIQLTIISTCFAEVQLVHLKGASKAINPKFCELSPAIGALYWYSPFIKNIYSYGPSSATKNLIQDLFSILVDGTFDCTHLYFNIARYLNPKDIGTVVALLQKRISPIEEIDNRFKKIEEELNQLYVKSDIESRMKPIISVQHELIKWTSHIAELAKKGHETLLEKAQKDLDQAAAKADGLETRARELSKVAEASLESFKQTVTKTYLQKKKTAELTQEEITNAAEILKRKVEDSAKRASADAEKAASQVIMLRNKLEEVKKMPPAERESLVNREIFEQEKIAAETQRAAALEKLNNLFTSLEMKNYFEKIIRERLINIRSTVIEGLQSSSAREEAQLKVIKEQQEKAALEESIKKNVASLETLTKATDSEFLGTIRVSDLIEQLVKGVQEEEVLYPKDTIKNILLGFAWKKAIDRTDFKKFYDGYSEKMGIAKKEIINLDEWADSYTQLDYNAIKRKYLNEFSFDDFILASRGFDLFESILPPILRANSDYSLLTAFGGPEIAIKDCGENALRNFFNLLLFTTKKTFDAELLKKLGAKSTLIDFYNKYHDGTKIWELEAYKDWLVIVSNIPGVQYAVNRTIAGSEIHTGIDAWPEVNGQSNMLKIINTLIPGADSWQHLKEMLDHQGVVFTFSQQKIPKEGFDRYDLQFSISKRNDPTYEISAEWQFPKNHFWVRVSPLDPSLFEKFKQFRNKCRQYLQEPVIPQDIEENRQALVSLFLDDENPEQPQKSEIVGSLFFTKMETPPAKLDLLSTIIHQSTYSKSLTDEILRLLFQSLNDFPFVYDAAKVLNLNTFEDKFNFMTTILKGQSNETFNRLLIRDLIASQSQKEDEHYKWASKEFANMKNKHTLASIVRYLIEKQGTSSDVLKGLDEGSEEYKQKAKKIEDDNKLFRKLEPLYSIAAKKILEINNRDDSELIIDIETIIEELIDLQYDKNKIIEVNPEKLKLITPFYSAVAEKIPLLGTERIVRISNYLFSKTIVTEEIANRFSPFYLKIMDHIQKTSNYNFVETIAKLIIKTANRGTAMPLSYVHLLSPLLTYLIQTSIDRNWITIITYFLELLDINSSEKAILFEPSVRAITENAQLLVQDKTFIETLCNKYIYGKYGIKNFMSLYEKVLSILPETMKSHESDLNYHLEQLKKEAQLEGKVIKT